MHESESEPLEALRASLAETGPWDLVVVDRIWSHRLVEALKEASGATEFVVMQWESPTQWEEIRWRISPTSRGSLVRFADALASGRRPQDESIPNLYWRDDSDHWHVPSASHELSVAELFAAPLDLAYDEAECFGLAPQEAQKTRYLVMNMGCPYRGAKNESTFLEGLDLPTQWGAGGCTFCNVGPYERQTRLQRRELMFGQLEALAVHGPYERLVVQDEYIFRDLDVLVDAMLEHGDPGVDLMVRARVDYLDSCREVLLSALEKFKGFGTITPYLIGFENFSDAELARYNKGQSAADGLRAARELERLAAEHENFRVSPSQGFILFGPWTTLEDLEVNLEALREVSFSRFRGSITKSKLRLNPDAALVARARVDGLLLDGYDEAHQDNAAGTGYQAEIPYSFAHAAVGQVWDLLNGEGGVEGRDELDRLERALQVVRASVRP